MPRILVIDDDLELRLVLKDALMHEGYEVVAAPDGVRGLQLVMEHPADLILLDVAMPNRDGLETLRLIRSVEPEVKVIIISAALTEQQQAEARRWQVAGFIAKPIGAETLLNTIANVLNQPATH
jgi:CheY-like chemotaxis protein